MRTAVSALLGTIAYFAIGWLVFEGLLGKYMAANTTQVVGFKKSAEESSMLMLLISCLAYAAMLAIVFAYWADVRTFQKGILLGAIIGVLVAVMTDSYWYSTSHYFNSLAPVAVDIAAAGVTVGIMGGVIGWSLGYFAKWL